MVGWRSGGRGKELRMISAGIFMTKFHFLRLFWLIHQSKILHHPADSYLEVFLFYGYILEVTV